MTMRDLLALDQHDAEVDVHCVTGWSVLGAKVRGVSIETICRTVGVLDRAKHLIFEGAAGYTANVPLASLRGRNNLLAYRLDGAPLALENGAPLRAVVPDLYFWKSAKWVTGLRFVEKDAPGYWETRGYHNRADPWEEQRYALF
jgi:DMSO/TMAO reductase YedYZ molybdopterin-dependent catalytic subunit